VTREESRKILVINGHPEAAGTHLCAALAAAYARGAAGAGHLVQRLDVGELSFPLIRSLDDYRTSDVTPDIERAQEALRDAEHVVMVFPIWFGAMPAFLKAFFEQVLRRGFALSTPQAATSTSLSGKPVRLIVTMGMPASLFRLALGAHGLKSFERGLLWVTGAGPVKHTLFGGAADAGPAKAMRWIAQVEALGAKGA
jgi:putative NADPH-quinone reductase